MSNVIETNSGTLEVNETNKKVYEVSALFVPELSVEELSQGVESIKNKLATLESEVISEGQPVHIKLAYTVEKHINNKIRRADYAHFYWVKFATEAANIKSLEQFLKLEMGEKIVRYLLVKTVRENTVLTELTEARQADLKNEALINEVLASDLKAETEAENADESKALTDLGGDVALKTSDEIEAEVMKGGTDDIDKLITEDNK
jgi:ribosomal protein S6